MLDIRFDPETLGSSARKPDPPAAAPPPQAGAVARPPASKADIERFCRGILAGWGQDVTQDWAYEKAVLFFADKKVARDAFRSILRSIRGPMKPGKRGKTGD